MPGLVPGIQSAAAAVWIAGTSPAMTTFYSKELFLLCASVVNFSCSGSLPLHPRRYGIASRDEGVEVDRLRRVEDMELQVALERRAAAGANQLGQQHVLLGDGAHVVLQCRQPADD